MSRSSRLASAVFLFTVNTLTLSAQEVYIATGSAGVAGTLYKFDVSSGQQLSSIPVTNASGGGAIGLTGMAVNPLNGTLYGVSVTKTISGGNTVGGGLFTINTTTGKATLLGALKLGGGASQVGDIAFSADGTLYGWESRDPFSLCTISLTGTVGTMTTIGNSGSATTSGG